MTERVPLSKAETEIARLLWELGEATVRQVHEAMSAERAIDFTTVQTYLRRLAAKGYADSRLAGHVRVYRSRVKLATVIRETVDDLVDRLFGGQVFPLMRHLIEDRGIAEEELAQLRDLLDRLEEEYDDATR